MKRKVVKANPAALERLRAIERLQAGATQREVAREFDVDDKTIQYWRELYEKGGSEALKVARKPRATYELSEARLAKEIEASTDLFEKKKLLMLHSLARTGKLGATAKEYDVSPQYLARVRQQYCKNQNR